MHTLDHNDSSSANNSHAFLCLVFVISRAAIEIKPTLAHVGDLLRRWKGWEKLLWHTEKNKGKI